MIDMKPGHFMDVYTAYRTDWAKKIVILRFYDRETGNDTQVDLSPEYATDLMGWIAKALNDIEGS